MTKTPSITPAPAISDDAVRALYYQPGDRKLIGYWSDGPSDARLKEFGATLTHPRDHADPTWPLEERSEIADALDACPVLSRCRGAAHNRMGAEPKRLGSADRGFPGWKFPEGLSYYVRVHAVRLDPGFVSELLAYADALDD